MHIQHRKNKNCVHGICTPCRTKKIFTTFKERNIHPSEETRKKMSISAKKVKHKPLSEITKQKLSINHIGLAKGEKNGMFGKHRSYSQRLKTSIANRKPKSYNSITEQSKQKISDKMYLRFEKLDKSVKGYTRLGNNETEILNRLEQLLDIKLIRQYSVKIKNRTKYIDGFDKINNCFYEVEERKFYIDGTCKYNLAKRYRPIEQITGFKVLSVLLENNTLFIQELGKEKIEVGNFKA